MGIRVLIADDHPIVRDGLRFAIERSHREIEVVGEAASGAEALEIAAAQPVDVFVLDITMPRLGGIDTTRELLRRDSGAKVILLSFHDSPSIVEAALATGAQGYLTKETAGKNVVEAICEVHAGHYYLSPDVVHYVIKAPPSQTLQSRPADTLTPQEKRILQLTAEGHSIKEIAVMLGRTVNTVQTHRKALMKKLDIHKQTDLVRFAVKEGIAKL